MHKLLELVNKSYKYLVASLLIIVPLYPKFPFLKIPGIYVSIRAEDFLLAVIAVATLIKLVPNIKNLLKDKIVRAIMLFLLVGFISLVSGIFLTKTVTLSIGALHFFRRIEYFIPFFAVFAFFPYDKGKNLEFYIKVLMIVIISAFIYGYGQSHFNFPVILTQDSESSKGLALKWTPGIQITSTFAGHYDLAAFMVLVLPIVISLFFTLKGRFSKLIIFIVASSGFWLLVNSASRISLASYLAAVFVSLILLKKYKAMIVIIIASVVLSGLSSNLFARYKSLIDVYLSVSAQETTLIKREEAPATPVPVPVFEDRSTSIRFAVEWPRAIRSVLKSPFLGTGYSSVGLATDNDYLRLLAEVGILGLVAFALIFIRILFLFISVLPLSRNFSGLELGFMAGIIGGIVGTLLNATFIDVFEASKFATIFWLLVGLAVYHVQKVKS
ncbi:MAG TPA: O-antigen ligase family protein [Alphaproteobacteria bacterium]|jgi:hypothetical protein|nr:O-antigen ligase family protein [Alphaproteobacteria bacterium]